MDKFLAGTMLPFLMRRKGWKDLDARSACRSSATRVRPENVKRQKKLVDAIVKKHNGMGVGTGPGVLYDQKKFDTPYLRDFLLDRGAAGDVSESAMPWSKLLPLYYATMKAANDAYDQIGIKGWIMAHLSALVPLGRMPATSRSRSCSATTRSGSTTSSRAPFSRRSSTTAAPSRTTTVSASSTPAGSRATSRPRASA